MFKTLAALVLSMSAGALLLASIEPGLTLTAPRGGVLLHARGPNTLDPLEQNMAGWRNLLVFCAADIRHKIMSANGVDTRRDAHLTIDPTGRLRVNPAWSQRRQLEGLEGTLVVCVELLPNALAVAPPQADALKMLVARFRRALNLTPDRIRYESLHPAIEDLAQHLAAYHNTSDALSLND